MKKDPATGRRIREQRVRSGLKLKELAKAADLSVATVANAERGKFTDVTLGAITTALKKHTSLSDKFESGTSARHPLPIVASSARPAMPQEVRWQSRAQGDETGMKAACPTYGEEFIPWQDLKPELERRLLTWLGRVLGDGKYTVETGSFHGREDWVIHILDAANRHVGYVWLGGDPYQGWSRDGLVRVGEALDDHHHVVWQIFQRFSDGTYRRIVALDSQNDCIDRQIT